MLVFYFQNCMFTMESENQAAGPKKSEVNTITFNRIMEEEFQKEICS